MIPKLKELRELQAAAQVGPWLWRNVGGERTNTADFALQSAGRGRYLVMDFVRMGMNGAQPRFLKHGQGIMRSIKQMIGDGGPFHWTEHPDARVLALSRELLDEVIRLKELLREE